MSPLELYSSTAPTGVPAPGVTIVWWWWHELHTTSNTNTSTCIPIAVVMTMPPLTMTTTIAVDHDDLGIVAVVEPQSWHDVMMEQSPWIHCLLLL